MKKVLITCGPTWAAIDAVRVISNISTGELGRILAQDLSQAGAKVTLLEGPVLRPLAPKAEGITLKKFCFYEELYDLLKKELRRNFDIVIHAAAVSDYKLRKSFKAKLKSGTREVKLTLVPTAKIINKIKTWSPKSFLIGFKLESAANKTALKAAAVNLIKKAKCDLVVANNVKNNYAAYIVNQDKEIIARASSRAVLSKHLVKILRTRL